MKQVPYAATIVDEMMRVLPLYCRSNKRNTQALAEQGLKLSSKTRLEVIGVRDFYEAGGIMCDVRYPPGSDQVLIMSITGLDFIDNGDIDKTI